MFKNGIVLEGLENTGKTTTVKKVFEKLRSQLNGVIVIDFPLYSANNKLLEDIWKLLKYKGKSLFIYSLGDKTQHFGKTNDLKIGYEVQTWQYKNYIDGISHYYDYPYISGLKDFQKYSDLKFQKEVDFFLGASRMGGQPLEFWKNRTEDPILKEKIKSQNPSNEDYDNEVLADSIIEEIKIYLEW